MGRALGGMDLLKMSMVFIMLEKQCWKIIVNPNAVVTMVLKGKYFPHGNSLPPNLGEAK